VQIDRGRVVLQLAPRAARHASRRAHVRSADHDEGAPHPANTADHRAPKTAPAAVE
jgi:hypothetical protein